ncbi:uroporphyrinogen-III synthase [Raphidocelis subcapitata]|uniref:Uroporphyrinogen-III synthase n=1 Tax=Raphidocelis subcapitata TaxID=307507 RepID=A0A2V0NQ09_9CHLO|nr:uroporphyrinogen-III synthase [Raphidocelis subcapitata]|eukprot:GBF89716.1 uroporphyrinogen-III synthase [Raphidocelis subcapitata]
MLTAPRQYAGRLAGLLIAAGAQPVWLPGIEITRLPSDQCGELDSALERLHEFDYLAFTSKNGIHAVMGRLEKTKGGRDAAVRHVRGSGARLCALGADGAVLGDYGLRVDVSPPEASTSGLVAELEVRGGARGARVLAPVPLVTGGLVEPPVVPRFIAGLERIGAVPTRVPAYLTTPGLPGPSGLEACAHERAALEGGHIAAIIFSSTAEAQGLCRLMGGRDALAAAVRRNRVALAAHGPYTAAGAGEVLGLPVPVVSRNFSTFEGVVAALSEAIHAAGAPAAEGGAAAAAGC